MTRPPLTKFTFIAYSAVTAALLIASANLAAAPLRSMGAGMTTPMGAGMTAPMRPTPAGATGPRADPPSPEEVLQPDDHLYRPVQLAVRRIVWYEPGQRGLIEAHPLVMGLAAMALATVTLLFFFLRGVKRPKDREL